MSEINLTESGTKGILWFKKDYSKDTEISTNKFLELQRQEICEGANANNSAGIFEDGRKTYNFNDQNSINESLWTYADKNKDDSIDEKEYNRFLAHSISNGIVGKRGTKAVAGMDYSLNGSGFVFSTGAKKKINADYEQLAELLNIYNEIKNEDSDIDLNDDSLLSKDEFQNSILTKLLTSDKGKEIINQAPSQDDIALAESLIDGPIADIKTVIVPRIKTGTRMDGKGTTTTTVLSKQTIINSDFDTLIDVAEKYRNLKN